MALRNIILEGDPTLEKPSREVTAFDDRLHTLLDDMWETLYNAHGMGLAAAQVGVLRRVAIVLGERPSADDAEEWEEVPIELINPVIVEQEGEETDMEGCLSMPGLIGMVPRPRRVKVRAQSRAGEWFEIEHEGFTARVICHELDHLDGKLYTELTDDIISLDELLDEEDDV